MAQLMDRLIEPRVMPMKVSIKGLRRDGSWMIIAEACRRQPLSFPRYASQGSSHGIKLLRS